MQKSATVALISHNKLLLLKRGSTAPWSPNKYCLPGGRVDNNEKLIDCAIRELYEETSISLQVSQLIPLKIIYPKYSKLIFVCNQQCEYSVNLNWEHSAFLWTKYSEHTNLDIVPGLDQIFNTLAYSNFLS